MGKNRLTPKTFLRGSLLILPVLVLIGGITSLLIRRDQALDRIDELGGGYNSRHFWLIRKLPAGWRSPLKKKFMPVANKVFGVGWVRRLEKVNLVQVRSSPAEDDDLKIIGQLSHVDDLDLQGTRITDEGLIHLKRLPMLRILELSGTQITGEGLAHLSECASLTHLNLHETQVVDSSLVHLKQIPNLSGVALDDTRVTDQGLSHLEGMPQLKRVSLSGTKVTDLGIQEFSLKRPDVRIYR